MPYIYVETLDEGIEAADVIERNDYQTMVDERDLALTQRDEAISRAENLEGEYKRLQDKYAQRFLTSAQQIKKDNERDVKAESRPQSFKSLFGGRMKNAN